MSAQEQQAAKQMRREVQGLCIECGGPIRAWLLNEMRRPGLLFMRQVCTDCYNRSFPAP